MSYSQLAVLSPVFAAPLKSSAKASVQPDGVAGTDATACWGAAAVSPAAATTATRRVRRSRLPVRPRVMVSGVEEFTADTPFSGDGDESGGALSGRALSRT